MSTTSHAITNSSPPKRATTSPPRTLARRRSATTRSSSSPAPWPSVSLTTLKRSRSSSSSATSAPSRAATASDWGRWASRNARFARPVSGSCSARRRESASACARSSAEASTFATASTNRTSSSVNSGRCAVRCRTSTAAALAERIGALRPRTSPFSRRTAACSKRVSVGRSLATTASSTASVCPVWEVGPKVISGAVPVCAPSGVMMCTTPSCSWRRTTQAESAFAVCSTISMTRRISAGTSGISSATRLSSARARLKPSARWRSRRSCSCVKKCIPSSPSTSGGGEQERDRRPVAVHQPLLQRGRLPAGDHAVVQVDRDRDVLGVRQVERAAPDQLVRLVAEQPCQGGVDPDPAQVRACDRHPDRRLLEPALEAPALVQLAQLAEGQRAAHERDRHGRQRQQLRRSRLLDELSARRAGRAGSARTRWGARARRACRCGARPLADRAARRRPRPPSSPAGRPR